MNDRTILWWYASGEQKFGPYAEDQLRELAQTGHVQRGDLIWHHGLADWVPAHTIEGLLPLTPVAPPVPSAAPDLPAQAPAAELQEPFAQAQTPAWTSAPSADTAAASSRGQDPLALFVGENYDFYARRWAESDQRFGGKISWNWAAFFLPPIWLLYRKMYAHCAALIAVSFFLTGVAQALGMQPQTIMQWQMYASPAVNFLFGLLGNWLYRQHAEKKVRQIIGMHGHTRQALFQLARQGGVNLTFALILLGLGIMAWLMGPKP